MIHNAVFFPLIFHISAKISMIASFFSKFITLHFLPGLLIVVNIDTHGLRESMRMHVCVAPPIIIAICFCEAAQMIEVPVTWESG